MVINSRKVSVMSTCCPVTLSCIVPSFSVEVKPIVFAGLTAGWINTLCTLTAARRATIRKQAVAKRLYRVFRRNEFLPTHEQPLRMLRLHFRY
ncbi:MAG: hypothetical protein GPOALKHO_001642 [Sodalis sp.]|nr:MAG: hypothetical protein GPOALKHO_001642 [Sodalis sp.]